MRTMSRRSYRPHLKVMIGPRWNSLIGWLDVSAIGVRWWECEGHRARGDGESPKAAYDAWYRDFIRPYNTNPITLAAYRAAQTPQFLNPVEQKGIE